MTSIKERIEMPQIETREKGPNFMRATGGTDRLTLKLPSQHRKTS